MRGDIGVGCILSMWIKLHDMGKYGCACDQNGQMHVQAEYLVYGTYWSIYGNYCISLGSAHDLKNSNIPPMIAMADMPNIRQIQYTYQIAIIYTTCSNMEHEGYLYRHILIEHIYNMQL